jgi:hypothetical protein
MGKSYSSVKNPRLRGTAVATVAGRRFTGYLDVNDCQVNTDKHEKNFMHVERDCSVAGCKLPES